MTSDIKEESVMQYVRSLFASGSGFLLVFALLLAACGGAPAAPQPTEAPAAAVPATEAPAPAAPATEAPAAQPEAPADSATGSLTVLDWAGYDAPDFWIDFQNNNPDVTVNFEIGASDADIYAKMKAGDQADIFHP
jgi:spermidine/putrescine-binding protein